MRLLVTGGTGVAEFLRATGGSASRAAKTRLALRIRRGVVLRARARAEALAEANHLLARYPLRESAMTPSTERTTHVTHDHIL